MNKPSAGGSYVRKPDGSLVSSNKAPTELPKAAPVAADPAEDTLLKAKSSLKFSEED